MKALGGASLLPFAPSLLSRRLCFYFFSFHPRRRRANSVLPGVYFLKESEGQTFFRGPAACRAWLVRAESTRPPARQAKEAASLTGCLSVCYSETSDLNQGLLIEVWCKGMLWDRAMGYCFIPLQTIMYEMVSTQCRTVRY